MIVTLTLNHWSIKGSSKAYPYGSSLNTLRLKQNGHHFADGILKCISLNENFSILNKNSLKYVPYGLIDNMAALAEMMAWHLFNAKPLAETMLIYCHFWPKEKFGKIKIKINTVIRGNACQSVHKIPAILSWRLGNSLGPSDVIWRWRSCSTLVQVMACCLTAPSHYLHQCWLIISKALWHSSEDVIIRGCEDTNQ